MDRLILAFHFINELKFYLKMGQGLKKSILECCEIQKNEFSMVMRQFLFMVDHGYEVQEIKKLSKNNQESAFFEVLMLGLAGAPIYEQLSKLQESFQNHLMDKLQDQINSLPIKCLIPVFFFMLPSYLILLFGPLLKILLGGVS